MKGLVFLCLLVAAAFTSRATHLMGGDVTVQYNSGANGYVLNVTLYRDTVGIPLDFAVYVEMYEWDVPSSDWVHVQQLTIPLNVALSTVLLPSFPYGVQVGVYDDTLTLAPGKYRFVNQTCCRNGAIMNMGNPLDESMVLYTDLTVDSANNNTPTCLAMPVAYFPINQPATYNPLPFDPDGDSIAWSLNVPLSEAFPFPTLTFMPVGGFITPVGAPSGPFTMNPVTGEITWTPNLLGNVVQSFEVHEYKGGNLVGTIIRDMQYVVIPDDSNAAPGFSMVTPFMTNTAESYNYIYYQPGQQLTFEIQGTDPNAGTQLSMEAFSPAFHMPNPASFTTAFIAGQLVGTFKWTPDANQNGDVLAVFRVRDGQFSKDFTLVMKKGTLSVGGVPTSINDISVFPNPTQNKLNVTLSLEKDTEAELVLYSVLGHQVQNIYSGKLMKGTTRISQDLNLAAGMYYLSVREAGNPVKTVAVSVQ